MANIGMIRIIRPIANTGEKEYIKEFFRFIGCFISDCPIDDLLSNSWDQGLRPYNEETGVDVVLNYYGKDPYRENCLQKGTGRLYLYFDLEEKICTISPTPLDKQSKLDYCKDTVHTRLKALTLLVCNLWSSQAEQKERILDILKLYVGNAGGDLFYLLQAKRSLRILNMGEVLREPSIQIRSVDLEPYLGLLVKSLWGIHTQLAHREDPYSCYTRINAASMIREIAQKLRKEDIKLLRTEQYAGECFSVPTVNDLFIEIQKLQAQNPDFISSYLLAASLCQSDNKMSSKIENCYLQALKVIPNNKKDYAFIWYRIGHYYEKNGDDSLNTEKALKNYQRAVEVNAQLYQAQFKLGYYAAINGKFSEATERLTEMIRGLFHGRSIGPDESGKYPNWDFLSLKDIQYVYKAYILLLKIAINSGREYSADRFVGMACLAATYFEEAQIVCRLSGQNDSESNKFSDYHKNSVPVWEMWKVLQPWSQYVRDDFICGVVKNHLSRWPEQKNNSC